MNNIPIDALTHLFAQLVVVIGMLAFAVSAVTEVIKSVGFMQKVPTNAVVIVLSMILTVVAFFAYAQYAALAIVWYMVVAAVLCGFFVAFIAMFGWDKLTDMWNSFKSKNNQ